MSNNLNSKDCLHLENLNQFPEIRRLGKEDNAAMIDKKRVYCLYRVSTLGQVEKDDIPMQRQCCREFAIKQGWDILCEKSEKGVSGFKVSAKDRSAIQEIQQDAILGKFDILLVFMFDRLGRKDDETPFVVEWFVNNGIEVWSVKEGQQRFESHVDKLTNYIRYWQASGESLKTSIRTKTRMGQLVQEGRYKGGTAPYGYRLVDSGIINKRNKEVQELQINETEQIVVKMIFDLYLNEGYGSQRIVTHLKEKGIRNRKGEMFTNPTIQHMLKNLTYTGILRCGESRSELIPHLQIIDECSFKRVQEMMAERSNKCKERTIPLQTKGRSLLAGNVYCGHCGGKLVLTTNGKRKELDESGNVRFVPKMRYVCYRKTRHYDCEGQTGYTSTKLDGMVERIITELLDKITDSPQFDDVIQNRNNDTQILLDNAMACLGKKQEEYKTYKAEVIKVLRGESNFNADVLNELINTCIAELEGLEREIAQYQKVLNDADTVKRDVEQKYDNLLSWSGLYKKGSIASKKMIISQLIKAVRVKRDYELEIDFNIAYEQYCTGF